MIVSIHQPAYLPWLGYFHKILLSDIFVFFDTTQFEKNSFVNRNKIKTPQGPLWLTVPVRLKGHLSKTIREIEVADDRILHKHWQSIRLNYLKSKFWNHYSAVLEDFYQRKFTSIADLCYEQLKMFIDFLGIKTKIVKASSLPLASDYKKSQLVLGICQELKADTYVSGSQGRGYINGADFTKADIKVYFQAYQHPSYQQLWGSFEPQLSVIDLLFNEGPNSLALIMKDNINKEQLSSNKKMI